MPARNEYPPDGTGLRHVTVLADDFSGACDTGIVFVGPHSQVRVYPQPQPAEPGTAQVEVFLTDTRKYPADQAAAIASAAAGGLPEGSRLYQKIDSTMRGSVGAEIGAILDARRWQSAVLCPAYPATGRTVVKGCLLVDGQPISKTQYGRDPRNPVTADQVGDIVHQTNPQMAVRTCRPGELADRLADVSSGAGVIVVDAASVDDLDQIAAVVADQPQVLPVGSAGLAKALARRWGLSGDPGPRSLEAAHVIIASGSANPRSLEQLSVLTAADPRFEFVRIDKAALLTAGSADAEMRRVGSEIRRILGCGRQLGIALSDERQPGLPWHHTFESFVAEAVAGAVDHLQCEPRDVAIVAGGADTCLSICAVLGISSLAPQAEIVPGIPWSIGNNGYNLISKAGGFGDEQALLTCSRFIRDRPAANLKEG